MSTAHKIFVLVMGSSSVGVETISRPRAALAEAVPLLQTEDDGTDKAEKQKVIETKS
jgi:hypothetical protein